VTEAGRAGLAALLKDPAGALLAFDYDGVLAPIVADPTKSPPHPRSVGAIAAVAASVGSVVVISGRPAQVVIDYGQFAREPALSRLVVFGHYGQERWDAKTGSWSPRNLPRPSPRYGGSCRTCSRDTESTTRGSRTRAARSPCTRDEAPIPARRCPY
jgi:trehalose 6-phosphate phosphatase